MALRSSDDESGRRRRVALAAVVVLGSVAGCFGGPVPGEDTEET